MNTHPAAAAAIVITPEFAAAELACILGDNARGAELLSAAVAKVESELASAPAAPAVEMPAGIAPLPARTTRAFVRPVIVDDAGFEYEMSIDDTAVERWDADGIETELDSDQLTAAEHEAWMTAVADATATIAEPTPTADTNGTDPLTFFIYDDNSNTLF